MTPFGAPVEPDVYWRNASGAIETAPPSISPGESSSSTISKGSRAKPSEDMIAAESSTALDFAVKIALGLIDN